jgi:hypothetical protein
MKKLMVETKRKPAYRVNDCGNHDSYSSAGLNRSVQPPVVRAMLCLIFFLINNPKYFPWAGEEWRSDLCETTLLLATVGIADQFRWERLSGDCGSVDETRDIKTVWLLLNKYRRKWIILSSSVYAAHSPSTSTFLAGRKASCTARIRDHQGLLHLQLRARFADPYEAPHLNRNTLAGISKYSFRFIRDNSIAF